MPVAEPTWELVLKRNSIERLKRDKSPLGMLDELPALSAAGYEQVPEEDLVRLKWWGLYHDKPKVGTFMLRIKLAGGLLTAPQLRAIGRVKAAAVTALGSIGVHAFDDRLDDWRAARAYVRGYERAASSPG